MKYAVGGRVPGTGTSASGIMRTMRSISSRSKLRLPARGMAFAGLGWQLGLAQAWADTKAVVSETATPQQVTNSTDIVRVVQTWVSQNHLWLWVTYFGVAAVVSYGLARFWVSPSGRSLSKRLQDEVLTNWRLALLGITSLALTLASGWTTWDGMTNFTGTPVLSFLITLGIQGIMLITAWLIGESFAVGLAVMGSSAKMGLPDRILVVLSVMLLAVLFYAIMMAGLYRGNVEFIDGILRRHKSELALDLPKENLRILIALGMSALLTTLVVSQKAIFEPYLLGLKAILKSLPIWLMFTACMLTSVFFSFDSLFSTIFPQQERERAAQLRTTNQIAGIIADLGGTITKQQGASIDGLFTSAEWKEYASRLNDVIAIARGAPVQIAELARQELENQQSMRAGFQERKASASSQQVRLSKHKEELLADVNKLNEEVPPVAAEVDRLKGEVFTKDSEILAKKAEMQAEAGGVGGTLIAGQGPEFQKRRKELDDFAKLKAILDGQLKDREAQLKTKRDRIASALAELAQIDGEIGKLTGEIEVADKQIADAVAPNEGGVLAASKASLGVTSYGSLDDAFAQFRQHPERASFDAVQQQCAALLTVFDRVPAIKSVAQAKGVRCDPSIVAEPVARVFALEEGLAAFKSRCAKPESLPQTTVDDLIGFGQQCVQTSGLAGQDTAYYRSQINSIGLNRDDKAHRFVVSWNAFLDGNRLAYLALGIAFALDGLVFMSGLFGANAVSSPLVRLPSAANRSASDLEATMYAALRPDVYGTAKLVINALYPIAGRDGFVSEIRTGDYDRETAGSMRRVLSAAAQFGGVRPDNRLDGVFQLRGELTEFLSKAIERELRTNKDVKDAAEITRKEQADRHAVFESNRQTEMEAARIDDAAGQKEERELQRRAKALEPVLTAALIPERMDDKETLFRRSSFMLERMRPTSGNEQFTSEIDLDGIPSGSEFFRSVLNAAAARKAVQRDKAAPGELYLIKPELIICLTDIRFRAFEAAQDEHRRQQTWAKKLWRRSTAQPQTQISLSKDADFAAQLAPAVLTPAAIAPSATVIAIGPPSASSGQKFNSSSARRYDILSLEYLEKFKQGLVLGKEGTVFDAILRNDWSNALDSNFSHLLNIDAFSDVLRQSVTDAKQQLSDFARIHEDVRLRANPPDVELVEDAFYGWQRLTSLHAHFQGRPVPASHRQLFAAIEGLMQNRSDAIHAFESAVSALDDAAPQLRLARATDLN